MKIFYITALFALAIVNCNTDKREYLTDPIVGIEKETFGSFEDDVLIRSKRLLDLAPLSVANKTGLPKGLDPRNYLSMACYWWPDPDTEDGLPYIRIDGRVNPETRTAESDLPKMIEMARRTEWLAVSFGVSRDEAFAEKAVELIHYWFVNEKTAMFPHLENAQMIKGQNTGRSFGIIDTWWLLRVVESVEVLKHSRYWSADLDQDLKKWFSDYTQWLYHSEFGKEEKKRKNNHGTWYDVQLVAFAYFSGNHNLARRHLEEVSRRRIYRQISLTGRQRHEARRPRPVHYSIFNLSGLIKLAGYGELLGVDVKNAKAFYSGGIEQAVQYVLEMVQPLEISSIPDKLDLTDTDLMYLDVLTGAWLLYGNTGLLQEMQRVYRDIDNSALSMLKNRDVWDRR